MTTLMPKIDFKNGGVTPNGLTSIALSLKPSGAVANNGSFFFLMR